MAAQVTSSGKLRVAVTDGRGRRLSRFGLARWLRNVAPRTANGELVVALVSDVTMRRLNRDFRGVNRATDVLSFPATTQVGYRIVGLRWLGDVVIATGVAGRQARWVGHSVEKEVRRLALHGLLHILGYDHERDDGLMVRLERRLLRKGGIGACPG